MEYRPLGQTDVQISRLCLGAMMFGGPTDEATAARITARAFAQGVNFIDTANVYHDGKSEEVVGRLVARQRGQWVVATKFGGGNVSTIGDGEDIRRAVEASLKRLGTDYIDLLYLHREVDRVPVEDVLAVLAHLIAEGKIRGYGVSNHRAWKIAQLAHLADAAGMARPLASQPLYNLANRQIEAEHITACAQYEIAVVPYSPLARGVLTAKYDPAATPSADTRAGRGDKKLSQTEWRKESFVLAQIIERHARERGLTSGQFALAWVLANRFIASAITGPRTLEQWEDYLPALAYRWTDEDEKLVDNLVASGHPSTPGYNDPIYPNFGRML